MIRRLLSLPDPILGGGYLLLYVLLEWLSWIPPIIISGGVPIDITPWDPGAGISAVAILLVGRRILVWLLLAPFIADIIIRDMPLQLIDEIPLSLFTGLTYFAAVNWFVMPQRRVDNLVMRSADLVALITVSAIAASIVAIGYVSVANYRGIVPDEMVLRAFFRQWIGDVIGIVVMVPFVVTGLTVVTRWRLTYEMVMQGTAIVIALVAVFTLSRTYQFQFFYLLFLPIIWIAFRGGFPGATIGIMFTQLGLIFASSLTNATPMNVTALQAVMLVLSITGLFLGVVVSERERMMEELHANQNALARVAKLSTMGEFAAAIAHEINQPLSALANYARLLQDVCSGPAPDAAMARDTASKIVTQVERSAEVVRKLRELIRQGRSDMEPVEVSRLFSDVQKLMRFDVGRWNITLNAHIDKKIPLVMADMLQIEQVLLNLLRNAGEAIHNDGMNSGTITLSAVFNTATHKVELTVTDTGPGFAPNIYCGGDVRFFTTTKPDGMGFGLALCRSIIEAHGGHLVILDWQNGSRVSFSLSAAEGGDRG